MTSTTYTVTIKTEKRNPQTFRSGKYHVARDASGSWRAFGECDGNKTDRQIAEYLFHVDEVKAVGRDGNGDMVVEVIGS